MSSDLQTPYLPLVTDDQRAQRDTLSVYAALYRNGEILGLTCGQAKHSRSLYTFTNIPQHLRPTNLQRAVLHPDWIDRFPFPHMRDACISSLDTFDEEEFLGDLFMMPSFNIASGYDSHDPHGWAITKEFKQKVCPILATILLLGCSPDSLLAVGSSILSRPDKTASDSVNPVQTDMISSAQPCTGFLAEEYAQSMGALYVNNLVPLAHFHLSVGVC